MAQVKEALTFIGHCWREDTIEWESELLSIHPPPDRPSHTVVPRPVQLPHPPLYLACTNPETVRRAAEYGVGPMVLGFGGPEAIATMRATFDGRGPGAGRHAIASGPPKPSTIGPTLRQHAHRLGVRAHEVTRRVRQLYDGVRRCVRPEWPDVSSSYSHWMVAPAPAVAVKVKGSSLTCAGPLGPRACAPQSAISTSRCHHEAPGFKRPPEIASGDRRAARSADTEDRVVVAGTACTPAGGTRHGSAWSSAPRPRERKISGALMWRCSTRGGARPPTPASKPTSSA